VPGRVARYAHWPELAEGFPLREGAQQKVLVIPWGNMRIERINSVVGLLNTRLRASMKPETLKRLLLMRVWLRNAFAKIESASLVVDIESLFNEVFSAVEEMQAASDGDSDVE
jgi:hypothetical protein